MHDVFGGTTIVERADKGEASETQRWSMFSVSSTGEDGKLADFFILPPSAATLTLSGEPLEEVQFLRDEMANMVWAIEHITETGIGSPWQGHERAHARRPQVAVEDSAVESVAPLKYRIQTTVPEHWIPFLPVHIDAARREIALQRAAMLRPMRGGGDERIQPVGRILQPTRLDDTNTYRVREEEVPRTGVRVSRLVRRSRWIDGSTHLWIARRKRAGAGEGSSGLRFDVAVATQRRNDRQ